MSKTEWEGNDLHNDEEIFIQDLVDLDSPVLIKPKGPSKCPLFCCFYAEFDIKKGPVIRHQCPKNFMDQDITTITTSQIHDMLTKSFAELAEGAEKSATKDGSTRESVYTEEGPENEQKDSRCIGGVQSAENAFPVDDNDSIVFLDDKKKDKKTDPVDSDEGSRLQDGGQSIFDSTSEYIITGSELTGRVITLSTHDMHVMTRPTQISDERYERNALLFSIGFVLRRAADPRPFRPLLSKLALTLRSMEIESGFLSEPSKRIKIQLLLEKILITMNSPRWECNLLLDKSTALNLKLYHPPKPEASPVHEYQVPVLLRRDLQLQLYEWDLAINWVILHIDGVTNARQISIRAEVDLEMVLACLRVLKHHGVIHIVDMFKYTNRYEFTDRATAMLAGKEDHLLREAVAFAMKRQTSHVGSSENATGAATNNSLIAGSTASGGSDVGNTGTSPKFGSPFFPSSNLVPPATPSSSYPPRTLNLLAAGGSQRSSNLRFAMMAVNSLERDAVHLDKQPEDRQYLKNALAELYCACNRNLSFGDIWLGLTSDSSSLQSKNSNNQSKLANQFPVSTRNQRNVRSRRDSFTDTDTTENNDVVIVSSPMEAFLIESMKKKRSVSVAEESSSGATNNKSAKPASLISSDWKSIFKDFDHRRFITFGIVHGLLIRIHSYPYFTGSHFPEKRVFSKEPPYASMDSSAEPSSMRQPINFRYEMKEEKSFQLAKAAAAVMDGTRCDDEIACKFEMPVQKVTELVEKYSGKKVIYLFSTLNSKTH
ncbi:nitrogen permease regulator 2 [Nitzschia inconspicua]|uniref:Nitrogen permease regulator 2 n=1 Tax=Nitzschia inconspicua TaxID=303405 RepID=A0A9K3KIH1_9STRA|nr:nitrogen permease regulator 2 [Nitzschia inconspicua]